jgi:hypothetical protein
MLSTLEKPLDHHDHVCNDQCSYVCIYESDTRICGYLIEFDYKEKVESKMIEEPYYGDIDLFGF